MSRSVGSVTTAASARHRVTSASAPMLACSSSTTAATMTRPRSSPPLSTMRRTAADHGGNAALHVLRTAAVEPAVADLRFERPPHPADADRVGVPAEHQRSASGASVEYADHVRTTGRGVGHLDAKTDGLELAGNPSRDGGFAASARRQRWIHRVDRDEIAQQRHRGIGGYSHTRDTQDNRRVNGTTAPEVVRELARAVRDAGGRALIVGGWVRDRAARGQPEPGHRHRGVRHRSRSAAVAAGAVRSGGSRRQQFSRLQAARPELGPRRHRRRAPPPRIEERPGAQGLRGPRRSVDVDRRRRQTTRLQDQRDLVRSADR